MTKSQLRTFAKNNDMTLSQARDLMKTAATEILNKDIAQTFKEFTWVVGAPVPTGKAGEVTLLPAGMSNTTNGIVNFQLFEKGKSECTYSLMSGLGISYIQARASFGQDKMTEYLLHSNIDNDPNGLCLQFGLVSNKKPTAAELQIYMMMSITALPAHIQQKMFDLGIKGQMPIQLTEVKDTAVGNLGYVESKV